MEAAGPSLPYATAYHAPVLCNAVVEGLVTDPAGLYIDATLGGGGHTAALLDRLAPQGRVLGIDRDADALAAATARLADAAKARRFRTVRGSFADLDLLLDKAGEVPKRVEQQLLDIQPGYSRDPVRGVYNHGWIIGDDDAISVATQAEIDALLEIVPVSGSSQPPA